MTVSDVVCSVLLLSGATSCVLGALGALRFPDVPSRMQATTKPQTLGLLLILGGAATRLEPKYAAGLLLVGVFQVITAPVLAQLFGRGAYRTGAVDRDHLVRDELADRLRDVSRGPGG